MRLPGNGRFIAVAPPIEANAYCGPVLRHSAEPIQAANFRSAVAF